MNDYGNYISLNIQRFGASISVNMYESDVSITNNTSILNIAVSVTTTGSSYNNDGNAYVSGSCWGSNNSYDLGTNYYKIGKTTTKQVYFGQFLMNHNNDGTCSAGCSIKVYVTSTYNNLTYSNTINLTTIARATTISGISGSSLNGDVTLTLSKKNSAFTHRYWYYYGGVAYETTPSSISGSSYVFTFTPETFASGKLGASDSKPSTYFLVRTYSGTTQIGSDQTSSSVSLALPDSYIPTIDEFTIDEAISSIKSKFGFFIQNESALSMSASGTGVLNSTIASYKFMVGDASYTTTSVPKLTDTITTSGEVTITAQVIDTRGRSSEIKTITINVREYDAPSISTFNVERDDTTPATLNITINSNVYSLEEVNTAVATLYYKKKTEATFTSVDISNLFTDNGDYKTINTTTNLVVSEDYQYDLAIYVEDYFNASSNAIKKTAEVGTAFVLMNYNSSGNGIAFGKVSEYENTIEFANTMAIYFGDTKLLWYEEE